MPLHEAGFKLVPVGFASRNPALDLPKCRVDKKLRSRRSRDMEHERVLAAGDLELKGEERATTALQFHPFSSLEKGNTAAAQMESVSVGQFTDFLRSRSQPLKQLPVTDPFSRAQSKEIARKSPAAVCVFHE